MRMLRTVVPVVALLLWVAPSAAPAEPKAVDYYCGGGLDGAFSRNGFKAKPLQFELRGPKRRVEGRLTADSMSELVFDAGRAGILAVPYTAIEKMWFGPPHDDAPGDPLYPWSRHHHSGLNYLDIRLRQASGVSPDPFRQILTFQLNSDAAGRTLAALEERTGRTISVSTPQACVQFRSRDECRYGEPSELRGQTDVFLDVSGTSEPFTMKVRQEIVSVLEAEGKGLTIVPRRDDASVVLTFFYRKGCNLPSQWCESDTASGEVYVARGEDLRLVLVYDDQWTVRHSALAERYASQFLEAFRQANAAP